MRIDQIKESVALDEDGAVVPILDPEGNAYTAADGSDVTMTILGAQSKARRKAEEAAAKSIAFSGRAAFEGTASRTRRINLAASCVTAWSGWEDESGAPIPFSPANVKTVLGADDRILTQVEVAISEHASFLKKSASV